MRGKKPPTLQCSNCGKIGHASKSCPKSVPNQIHAMMEEPDDASESSAEQVIICATAMRAVDSNYLLLDSQRSVDQFVSDKYLTSLCTAPRPVTIHCNAGTSSTDKMADFGTLPVYYNRDGIANVLSLNKLGMRHRITYDSTDRGGVFIVHTPHGPVEFKPDSCGLHLLDLDKHPESVHMLVNSLLHFPPPSSLP